MWFLCAGGCNNDITPVFRLIKNLLNLSRIFFTAGLLVVAILYFVKYLRNKDKNTKKKSIKTAAKFLISAIVVFFLLTCGSAVFGLVVDKNYDKDYHCWCN